MCEMHYRKNQKWDALEIRIIFKSNNPKSFPNYSMKMWSDSNGHSYHVINGEMSFYYQMLSTAAPILQNYGLDNLKCEKPQLNIQQQAISLNHKFEGLQLYSISHNAIVTIGIEAIHRIVRTEITPRNKTSCKLVSSNNQHHSTLLIQWAQTWRNSRYLPQPFFLQFVKFLLVMLWSSNNPKSIRRCRAEEIGPSWRRCAHAGRLDAIFFVFDFTDKQYLD